MKDNKIVMDIDVADNVKEVEIWHNFRMPDTNKSFPNVEKLIIKEYVNDINIPNSLFTNVKYVESENDFGNEDAKKHIKKHIGRILPMLLNEKNEECISTLIMANIIPDDTLEELRETANQKSMLTVQAYLLEHIDNKKNAEKKSQTFQL